MLHNFVFLPLVLYVFCSFFQVNLQSPNLPTKFPDKEREAYQATRDKVGVSEPILKSVNTWRDGQIVNNT